MSNNQEIESFHMSNKIFPVVAGLGLLFAIVLMLVGLELKMLLVPIAGVIIFTLVIWPLAVIRISDEGIRYHWINKLVWEEVVSAEKAEIFKLPYLLIIRRRGLKWWLPLYYTGSRRIEVALRESAPKGNPIREVLNVI